MNSLGFSTTAHCSQCQGNTYFYCNTSTHELCLQCKEGHVTAISEIELKKEFLLKVLSLPDVVPSITEQSLRRITHISCLASDLIWICDWANNLFLTTTAGRILNHVSDVVGHCQENPEIYSEGVHTVNLAGDLIYINKKRDIIKLSRDSHTKSQLFEKKDEWNPVSICSSHLNDDLFVGMYIYKDQKRYAKVHRYKSTGELKQTIQEKSTGDALYKSPIYIIENHNGDVVVSDWGVIGAIVVTDSEGRYRFSYEGNRPTSELDPNGICVDTMSNILVCNSRSDTIHIIDKNGNFLLSLLNVRIPSCLSYDEKNHILFVGSYTNNKLYVLKYFNRQEYLTGVDSREEILYTRE